MCGICGAAGMGSDPPIDSGTLHRMTEALRHRGPDSGGCHLGPGIALGVRRLAIVDVKGGDQPLTDDTGRIFVVGNGEIYNHVELRRDLESRGHRFSSGSDMEVVPHLYREEGDGFVTRLRGMFALAVWDSENRRLLLARDRFGIKPLMVAENNGRIAFASEVKSLLAGGCAQPEVDFEALGEVFDVGFILQPRTMFRGVRQLRPGHILVWRDGRCTTTGYWAPPFSADHRSTATEPEELARRVLDQLRESVRLHMRADVPVCSWLSPGIDSSLVTRLASDELAGTLHTYTLSFDEPESDETRRFKTLAAFPGHDIGNTMVAGAADLNRLPWVIRHVETPLTYGTPVSRDRLAEVTARDFRVALTGEGADEILGGYDWYRLEKAVRAATWLPAAVRRLLPMLPLLSELFPRSIRLLAAPTAMNLTRYAAMVGPPKHPALTSQLFTKDVREAIRHTAPSSDAVEQAVTLPSWPRHNQLQYIEMQTRLPEYINATLDRTTMAHSIEARLPFLDHPLVELCTALPPHLLMRRLREKYILRRGARDVLPDEIVRRRKRGLSAPVHSWFRAPLPSFAVELLAPDSLRSTAIFEPATVTRLLEAHRAGAARNGRVLLGVLTMQLWHRSFNATL